METYHRNMIRRWVLSLHKTVRKYFGEAVVVTQELDDIVSSPIIKDTIINNADCKILLDQRKYINKFDSVQSLLGLTDKEKGQILSINQANDPARKYKEVWIGLGGVQSAVYATETSVEEYLTYTTEETEKLEVTQMTLSLIHISEPTRQAEISYAVFCLKKKKKTEKNDLGEQTYYRKKTLQ